MSSTPWENEKERNFICMNKIVSKVVKEGLRKIFRQEWNSRYQAKLGAWDDTSVSGQQLHNLEQTRKRPPRNAYLSHFLHGDTSQWDCTVLFDAILYSKSIGSARLNPTIKTEANNLRKIRNKVIHDLGGRLSDDHFQAITTDVENAFKALGLPTKDITRIKAERNRYKSFQVLPPKPAHDVVPRFKKIREINEDLEKLRVAGELTYLYISGNPGSGKSQLARQICENIWQGSNCSEEPTFVMTLNGKEVDYLLNSYENFARRLNCDESVLVNILSSTRTKEERVKDIRLLITTRIKNWKKWWLVVDNVENLETISSLLPLAGEDDWNNGQIIVTTQNRNHVPPDSLLTKHISISRGMSDLESRKLLSTLSGSDCDDPLLDKVAEQLDRQPLAMAAAAVYFKRMVESRVKFSWHDYLEKLDSGKRKTTEKQLWNSNPAYSSTMTAAVLLAVEKCAENDSNLKHAFQFFSLVSFESTPLDLVAEYIQLVDENSDREEVFLAIRQCSLFLPAENEHCDIRLHRVVHEVIRVVCESKTNAEMAHVLQASGRSRVTSDVKCQLENVVQTLYHFKDRGDKKKLVPHLKAFNLAIKKLYPEHEQFYLEGSSTNTNEMFEMYMFFGHTLRECYEFKLSIDLFTSSLQLSQGLEDELCVADVFTALGNVHEDMYEWEKAKNCHQRALEIRRQHLGEKHIDVASSYTNLGIVHHNTYEYEKAKDYLQRALEIRKQQLGEKHIDVALSYNNLGVIYDEICEHEKAKDYTERSLEIYKEQLGEKSLAVAECYNNLGCRYEKTHEYEKAKDYHLRALEIRKQQLGDNHVNVADSYNNLGQAYWRTGEMGIAKDYHQRALEIRKQQLGEEHVNVATSYNNLGSVYKGIGDLAKAKEYCERALEIYEEQLGEKHIHFAESYDILSAVCRTEGEYEKAKDYLQKAVQIRQQLLGEQHVDVALSYDNLGYGYWDTAEYEKAEDCYLRSLEIRKQQHGETHTDVACSYIILGCLYLDTGEYAKAEDCQTRALEIRKQQLGEKHIDVAHSYSILGRVYKCTREMDRAKHCHEKALEIRKQQLGDIHADVVESYYNLSEVYLYTDGIKKAIDCHQQILEIRKKQLGNKHVDVAASYRNLAISNGVAREYEKARDYIQRAVEIYKEQSDEKNVKIASSYSDLGKVYKIIGENEEAKGYLHQGLDVFIQQVGEQHVDVAACYTNLGEVYKDTSELGKAKEHYERALEIYKEQLGEEHVDVAACYNNLAGVYERIGDLAKAKECFGRALDIRQ